MCACGESQDLRGSHSQNNLLGGLSPGLGGWNPPFSGFHPPPCLDQPLPLLALVSQLSHEADTELTTDPACGWGWLDMHGATDSACARCHLAACTMHQQLPARRYHSSLVATALRTHEPWNLHAVPLRPGGPETWVHDSHGIHRPAVLLRLS